MVEFHCGGSASNEATSSSFCSGGKLNIVNISANSELKLNDQKLSVKSLISTLNLWRAQRGSFYVGILSDLIKIKYKLGIIYSILSYF